MINFIPLPAMEPLGAERSVYAFEIAGIPLYEHFLIRSSSQSIIVQDEKLAHDKAAIQRMSQWGYIVVERRGENQDSIFFPKSDGGKLPLYYPWDLLAITEEIVSHLEPSIASDAIIEPNVEIEGNVRIESGVHILSGARIKRNVYIGANSFIGNLAIVRDNVSLGPNSAIGFAADLQRSLVLEETQIGPLSIVTDCVFDSGCFLGGVIRTSNYRLDGKTISVLIDGELMDTNRIRFGLTLGTHVSMGIACVTFPGRKIGAHSLIGPQVNVVKNIPARKRVMLEQSLSITDWEG